MRRKIIPGLLDWKQKFNSMRRGPSAMQSPPSNNQTVQFFQGSGGNSPMLSDTQTIIDSSKRSLDFNGVTRRIMDIFFGIELDQDHNTENTQNALSPRFELFQELADAADYETPISSDIGEHASVGLMMSGIERAQNIPPSILSRSAYTAPTHQSFFEELAGISEQLSRYENSLIEELTGAAFDPDGDLTPLESASQSGSVVRNRKGLDDEMRAKADITDAAKLLSMLSSRPINSQ